MLASIDGRAICKEIKENHLTCFLPVILISGTHDMAESLQLPGAPNDFVAKPFDIDHLLQVGLTSNLFGLHINYYSWKLSIVFFRF